MDQISHKGKVNKIFFIICVLENLFPSSPFPSSFHSQVPKPFGTSCPGVYLSSEIDLCYNSHPHNLGYQPTHEIKERPWLTNHFPKSTHIEAPSKSALGDTRDCVTRGQCTLPQTRSLFPTCCLELYTVDGPGCRSHLAWQPVPAFPPDSSYEHHKPSTDRRLEPESA